MFFLPLWMESHQTKNKIWSCWGFTKKQFKQQMIFMWNGIFQLCWNGVYSRRSYLRIKAWNQELWWCFSNFITYFITSTFLWVVHDILWQQMTCFVLQSNHVPTFHGRNLSFIAEVMELLGIFIGKFQWYRSKRDLPYLYFVFHHWTQVRCFMCRLMFLFLWSVRGSNRYKGSDCSTFLRVSVDEKW